MQREQVWYPPTHPTKLYQNRRVNSREESPAEEKFWKCAKPPWQMKALVRKKCSPGQAAGGHGGEPPQVTPRGTRMMEVRVRTETGRQDAWVVQWLSVYLPLAQDVMLRSWD